MIRADIRKNILYESESTRCFRSLVCYISKGDWLCYFVQMRKVIEKFIYGCYNIAIQSDNFEVRGEL